MSVSKRNEINLTEQYNIDSKALVAKEKLVILAEPVKSSYVFLEGHKNLSDKIWEYWPHV